MSAETKVGTAISDGDAEAAVASCIASLEGQLGGRAPSLVIAFASVAQPLEVVMPALAAKWPNACALGTSTAGEFTEEGDRKSALAVAAVAGDFVISSGIGRGLAGDPEGCIDQALEGQATVRHGYPHTTAILLLDPLAGNAETATLIAADRLGVDARLAGGAAGDDLSFSRTSVGCGSQVASDAAVIALVSSKKPLGVGVSHGHRPLPQREPVTVTRAEGATVYEVDGRPAWDVWVERTKAAALAAGIDPQTLSTPEEIGGYLLRYEGGLAVGEDEEEAGDYKIRAPLTRGEGGAINFACAIPEGSVLHLTESIPERQIDSAFEAALRARQQLGGEAVAGAVVFDCICRNLILGDRFAQAVKGMSKALGGAPLAGFETYGEIALDVGDMSGFHNTTTVVLAFPR